MAEEEVKVEETPKEEKKQHPKREKKEKQKKAPQPDPLEGKETVTYVYHPAELSLKGKNRGNFEDQLSKNMKLQLKHAGVDFVKVEKIHGRHFVSVPAENEEQIKEF